MRNKAWRMAWWTILMSRIGGLFGRFGHGRRPPADGVREPRRPRPTLPGAAVALAEPRSRLRARLLRFTRD